MTVSFTGVSNLRMFKKKPVLEGFLDIEKGVQSARKHDEMVFKMTIVDDAKGNDAEVFNSFMETGLALKAEQIKDTSKPNEVTIKLRRISYPYDEFKKSENSFMVNNTLVPLNKNSDLNVFTYLAKLTKKLSHSSELTKGQQSFMDDFHTYVNEEAVNYINR